MAVKVTTGHEAEAERHIKIVNEQGYAFDSFAALQAWEAWARQRLQEGLQSPEVPSAEAEKRIAEVLQRVRDKLD